MPKLWNETIDAHRRAVREATLDATAALVAEHGLASVTMSQIAKDRHRTRHALQVLSGRRSDPRRLSAASALLSTAAVRRLVTVTMTGLRPATGAEPAAERG